MKIIELDGNNNRAYDGHYYRSKHLGLFKRDNNWTLYFHVKKVDYPGGKGFTSYSFHLDIGPIHLLVSSDLKRYQVITLLSGKVVYPKERRYN